MDYNYTGVQLPRSSSQSALPDNRRSELSPADMNVLLKQLELLSLNSTQTANSGVSTNDASMSLNGAAQERAASLLAEQMMMLEIDDIDETENMAVEETMTNQSMSDNDYNNS